MFGRGLRAGGARLPMIRQGEAVECGLACVAMVACYYGHKIDLAGMRRRAPTSLQGSNLKALIAIAGLLDLQCRALRVELEFLRELKLPCIAHWNLNHFVVIKRVTKTGADIHDPAHGTRWVSLEELDRSLSGVVLELQPRAEFRTVEDVRKLSWRSLTGSIQGLRSAVTQVLMLALVLEALTLSLPLAMQWVLDSVLVSADYSLLTILGIGFVFVVLFQSAVLAMRGWLVAGVSASLEAQWVSNLFGHLMRLPFGYFEKRKVADIMSRFQSVQLIQQTLSSSFIDALLDGLTVGLVLVVLLSYSVPMTLLVLTAMLFYGTLRWVSAQRLHRLNESRLINDAQQHGQMLEAIQGAMSIILGNRQQQRHSRIANSAIEVANADAAIQRFNAGFTALARLIFGCQRIGLIWIGAFLTLSGQFSIGMLVVFVAYSEVFAQRASLLIDHLVELRMLRLHAERIADVALEDVEADITTGYSGPTPDATISVHNLSFRYAEDEPWVLHNCSFQIEAGEHVAIVGPSGSGKTTLAKLLLGLIAPTEGTIEIGGIDIRRYGLGAYRDLYGTVMQEDRLLAGSVAENIAFFDHGADSASIFAAAKAAAIHDDIAGMKMGYETLVGDMGSALSSGQKQRVLLARALFKQPRLLLLDEATSHLDVEREAEINQQIASLDLTRLVIAHRPDTIARADRIIEIREGQARERPRPKATQSPPLHKPVLVPA